MAFIGKNTIENLTTAMYEDLRIIYREYIQNSADSIDHAIEYGLITQDEALINIEIDKKKKSEFQLRWNPSPTMPARKKSTSINNAGNVSG